jgi:hypothetical protein
MDFYNTVREWLTAGIYRIRTFERDGGPDTHSQVDVMYEFKQKSPNNRL